MALAISVSDISAEALSSHTRSFYKFTVKETWERKITIEKLEIKSCIYDVMCLVEYQNGIAQFNVV